jgi:hypothetical protein
MGHIVYVINSSATAGRRDIMTRNGLVIASSAAALATAAN